MYVVEIIAVGLQGYIMDNIMNNKLLTSVGVHAREPFACIVTGVLTLVVVANIMIFGI